MKKSCFGGTDLLKTHPCLSKDAHHRYGRIHLPVAPACNIQCGYCVRKYDCANESRPGVTSRVLTAAEAFERVGAVVGRDERITVVGVAGPGDPLANEATFELFRAVGREFPEITLCASTNGLMLPARVDELAESGVKSLTVTINTLSPKTAARIYRWVRYEGETLKGEEAGERLVGNQWLGLKEAVKAGMVVKVNTILLPGINDGEIPDIARAAGALGAAVMNVMPLIPQGTFEGFRPPDRSELDAMRLKCGDSISQIGHCRQCRADAAGMLGEDRDMEMEALIARLADDYAEMVA